MWGGGQRGRRGRPRRCAAPRKPLGEKRAARSAAREGGRHAQPHGQNGAGKIAGLPPAARGRDASRWGRLLRVASCLGTPNPARDGAPTAALGNLCPCLPALAVKHFCLPSHPNLPLQRGRQPLLPPPPGLLKEQVSFPPQEPAQPLSLMPVRSQPLAPAKNSHDNGKAWLGTPSPATDFGDRGNLSVRSLWGFFPLPLLPWPHKHPELGLPIKGGKRAAPWALLYWEAGVGG